jgi:hypothetical protein
MLLSNLFNQAMITAKSIQQAADQTITTMKSVQKAAKQSVFTMQFIQDVAVFATVATAAFAIFLWKSYAFEPAYQLLAGASSVCTGLCYEEKESEGKFDQ